jgi:hypothetical protein
MNLRDRREFLAEVGQGMLAGLIGTSLAVEMGLASTVLGDEPKTRTPDSLERLVTLLQQTPIDRLLAALVGELGKGTDLKQLVAAGALSNARCFRGQNYDGYHTFMALAPSYLMARSLPAREQALPVLKVLHRNSRTMDAGKPGVEYDHTGTVKPGELKPDQPVAQQLLETARTQKPDDTDRLLAALAGRPLDETYNDLQLIVQEDLNVHRVVLAWRAWETLDFTGKDHAQTLLRQTVRFCSDKGHQGGRVGVMRTVLPTLFDRHKLADCPIGTRKAEDAWVEKLALVVYKGKADDAAGSVAEALADGFSPDSISEAISLAAVMLLLGDPGRPKEYTPDKRVGSVHGDSVGLHASDAANAWRHIAAVSSKRNTFASLITAAYHTAGQAGSQLAKLYPLDEDVDKIKTEDPAKLLAEMEEAIRARDQRRSAALAHRYLKLNLATADLLAVLLRYSISEDGALHAEKYYCTATEEFQRCRPAFRGKHVVALARVCASAFGKPAPGMEEARKLLKL